MHFFLIFSSIKNQLIYKVNFKIFDYLIKTQNRTIQYIIKTFLKPLFHYLHEVKTIHD